jgi:hypothetical protein
MIANQERKDGKGDQAHQNCKDQGKNGDLLWLSEGEDQKRYG